MKVKICALLSPAKVNDDGEISVSHAGIVDPRPPIHITRPGLYTDPDEVATGMQRLNLEPPEFIRKSGGS